MSIKTESAAEKYAREHTISKLEKRFESYETLADGKCRVTCEFGTWTARDKPWAEGAVSKLRYNYYWSKISPFDIRREQD